MKNHHAPIQITDEHGYIVDPYVRVAYDRIISHARWSADSERAAEAFLRLIERYAAKGIHLLEPDDSQRRLDAAMRAYERNVIA